MPLILPDGYKNFQKKVHDYTPGHLDGVKKPHEVGSPVKAEDLKRAEAPETLYDILPKNFCPSCDMVDVTKERQQVAGLWIAEETHPELQWLAGEVVHYFKCIDCLEGQVWRKQQLWMPPGSGDRIQRVGAEKAEQNLLAFMRSARLNGHIALKFRSEGQKCRCSLCQ